MADYILGAVLVLLFVLAARSYFGRKFGSSGCGSGCKGCPHAKACGHQKK
ncbi:MAG: FeoB-associated Cys-rich membrane protein [Phascolarctobacterium sp.]